MSPGSGGNDSEHLFQEVEQLVEKEIEDGREIGDHQQQHDKSNTKFDRECDEHDVRLWHDPGENSQGEIEQKHDDQKWRADLYSDNKQKRCQLQHVRPREMDLPLIHRNHFKTRGQSTQVDLVAVYRQKYQDGQHGEEIADNRRLLLGHRIDHICKGENDLQTDRKSTRLNSSHVAISYAVFCLKKKKLRHKKII